MFENRFDAAYKLVPYLEQYRNAPDTIILAIPRGGLELGNVLAKELHLPLDIVLTKKIGAPNNPESAIGAVSEKHIFINPIFAKVPQLQPYIEQEATKIRAKLAERAAQYRQGKAPLAIHDKTVIIVDDGVATGQTMLATIALVREMKPKKIVIALPVAPRDTVAQLQRAADEVVCLLVPDIFYAVGQFYKQFNQVEDQEAIALLHEAQS